MRVWGGWMLSLLALGVTSGPATLCAELPRSTQVLNKEKKEMNALLEPIRVRHDVPALAAAVILDGKVVALGATGMRKYGGSEPVSPKDQFHLGSCTKAMTATLLALLVEEGKLKWDTTLAEIFPEWKKDIHPGYRDVTVEQLLTHRGGFPERTEPMGKSLLFVHNLPGTVREKRAAYVRMMLKEAPSARPGTQFIYSNAGYTVAGAVAEKKTGIAYEELLTKRLFQPLGMKSAGFGAMGAPGKVDQPWQHTLENGKPKPIAPGPLSDNPPAIAPAGTVHCSLEDWAKFVLAHLEGETKGGLLKAETFRKLHTPPDGDYAFGWGIGQRPWAGGRVLTHAGSNTMNYAVVWIAPKKNFAVLITTNQGGNEAAIACDEAAAACIGQFLTPGK